MIRPVHMAGVSRKESGVRMGLRGKVVAAFALQTIFVALLLVLIQQYLVRRSMIEVTVQQGSAIAETVKATAGYYVIFGLTDDLKKIAADLARNRSVEYAEFLDANGKVLAATDPNQPTGLAGRVLERERGTMSRSGRKVHIYTEPFFETEADAKNPNAKPKGFFRLLMNEAEAETAMGQLLAWNIGTALLVLILASVIALLASRFIVRPILSLVETAGRIAKGDLTQRAQAESKDEIGVLAEA